MKKSIISAVAIAGAVSTGVASTAYADDSLTMYGITLYGTVDMGVAYQTHGAPLNSSFAPGLDYLISKASNNALWSAAPNGLSQSAIGLKGSEPITDEFSAVFKLEAQFEPQSGQLADSPKSLTENNGIALNKQSSNGDSSRAGQAFTGASYAGISSKDYGTLTVGRQNTVLLDDIIAYDPQGASNAFSVIGFSGAVAGAGDTQDARFDDSVEYSIKVGPLHGAAIYQFAGTGGNQDGGYELDLGAEYAGLSVDGVYSRVNDAVSAAALSAAQVATSPTGSLAATVSDNTAYTLNAKYVYGPAKVYAGYERIEFANPSHPLSDGTTDIGGYDLSVINNSAYTLHKILDVYWAGLKFSVSSDLDLTGAYYHYSQNSYKGNGCSDASAGSCSGTLDAYSIAAVYHFSKRFDGYGGAMYSTVANGLANGYLNTHTVDPMVGVRFKF